MRVVIVGAGVIGQAVGFELASRGAEVEILDPRGSGRGATAASAGILAPHIEGHSQALLDLGVCSLLAYDPFVRRLTDSGASVEYRRIGTLQVAVSDSERNDLAAHAARLTQRGIAHELLDGDAARECEPSLRHDVVSALRIPEHAYVNVPSLMASLDVAGAALGLTVAPEAVTSVASSGHGVIVTTSGRTRTVDAVVIAAGSWSGSLGTAQSPNAVRPIRGQLVHLRCATQALSHVVWGTGSYLVPWRDGSVLVGATVEDVGFDERSTLEGVRLLLDRAADLVPALGRAEFVGVRSGLRPLTPDELPIIGPSSTMPDTYYATGHYRNGVLLAPLTASAVAAMVLDRKVAPELESASPSRFGL